MGDATTVHDFLALEPFRSGWRGSGLSGPRSVWSIWFLGRDRQDRPSHERDGFEYFARRVAERLID